jgi:N-acylneuraminate cytidylyltransferase
VVHLSEPRVLAVVPARGGSKGLPGKNLLPLASLPLLEHSLRFAHLSREIERTIVSTDSGEIAQAARDAGAEVPFLRPAELARDETPMWPVLRHALECVDPDGDAYDLLVLLDPTAPAREHADLRRALDLLDMHPDADGVVAVAEPSFNPVWQTVVERDGFVEHAFPEGARYTRRQDAPRSLFVCGTLYVWRTSFVRAEEKSWFHGRLVPIEIPRERAITVDGEHDLRLLEVLVAAGVIRLPWLRDD